jgi:dephospho-CoA kinase
MEVQTKMTHIILEGCDLTGKTTLANYLSEKLHYPIVKFSSPKNDPYESYVNALMTAQPTIFDRLYIGECVYGPIKRSKSYLSNERVMEIETLASQFETFNIYTVDTTENIKERYKERGDSYINEDEIESIVSEYEKQIQKSGLNWHRYTINGLQGMKDTLKAYKQHE